MSVTPTEEGFRLRPQFALRTMLGLMFGCCLVACWDPLEWRNLVVAPRPIRQVPFGHPVEVDVIELNHRRKIARPFDQLLFWSYHSDGKLHIREWRIVRDRSMLLTRDGDGYHCTWTKDGVSYTVRAPTFRETTADLQNDPELVDRELLAKQNRIKLWK